MKMTRGIFIGVILMALLCLAIMHMPTLTVQELCKHDEGYVIQEFENASCVIGPGKYSCCTVRTQ